MKKILLALIAITLFSCTTVLAEITRVKIWGKVTIKNEQEFKEKQFLSNVSIRIVEIDNEPATENETRRFFRTDDKGMFNFVLDESFIEDIREITSIKFQFSRQDYKDAYMTIGPITKSNAKRKESVEIEDETYIEKLEVSLIPESFDFAGIILESFEIDEKLSIFKEGNLVQSPSPFKNSGLSYFHVPDDFDTLKMLAGKRYTAGSNPHFERIFWEIKPLIIAMSDMALKREDVVQSPTLKKVFSDTTGIELFKVIIPAGKSFTTDLEGLSDEDIRLRIHTFRLIGLIIKNLEQDDTIDPVLKKALTKYKILFNGLFEPVFIITIRNNSKHDYILKHITVEVKEVELYMGEEEKGKIPIAAIYDIPIEPKVGITKIAMNPELHISPKTSDAGSDIISFKIRLLPETPYLHSYLMRFKILTDRNVEISTPFFVIDM